MGSALGAQDCSAFQDFDEPARPLLGFPILAALLVGDGFGESPARLGSIDHRCPMVSHKRYQDMVVSTLIFNLSYAPSEMAELRHPDAGSADRNSIRHNRGNQEGRTPRRSSDGGVEVVALG
jgi:hypothetical protein